MITGPNLNTEPPVGPTHRKSALHPTVLLRLPDIGLHYEIIVCKTVTKFPVFYKSGSCTIAFTAIRHLKISKITQHRIIG